MSLSAACNFTASASTVSATGTLYAAAGTLCTLALVDSSNVYHGDVDVDCGLIPEAAQTFRLNPNGWSAKFQLPPIDAVLSITITVSDVNGSTAQSQFNLVVVKDGQLPVTLFGADPTGSVDSSGAFQAAVNALAGTGVALYVPAGTYLFNAGIILRYNAPRIQLSRDTTLVANLSQNGGLPFGTQTVLFYAAPTYGTQTTLTAGVAVGATVLPVTSAAALSVGATINLTTTGVGPSCVRMVKAINGLNVTLDRPIWFAYPSGSTVQPLTNVPQDIVIDGGMGLLTGTCQRFIEIVAGQSCAIRNLRIDDSQGLFANQWCCSFDEGSDACTYENVHVAGPYGIALESNEGSRFIACSFIGRSSVAHYGFTVNDSVGCEAIDCTATGNIQTGGSAGVLLATGGSSACYGCVVRGGTFIGLEYGIHASNTVGCAAIGTKTSGDINGILVDSACVGFQITSADASDNSAAAGNGVAIVSAAKKTVIDGLLLGGNGNAGLLAQGDCVASNVVAKKADGSNASFATSGSVIFANDGTYAPVCELTGFDLLNDGTGTAIGVSSSAATIRGGHIVLNNASAVGLELGVPYTAPTVRLDGVIMSGTGAYSIEGSGGTVRMRQCDLGGLAQLVTSVHMSPGTVTTAAGATAVAWPDLKASDVIMLTATGAAPTAYVNSKTPGTGFSVTDSGAHAYDYVVE